MKITLNKNKTENINYEQSFLDFNDKPTYREKDIGQEQNQQGNIVDMIDNNEDFQILHNLKCNTEEQFILYLIKVRKLLITQEAYIYMLEKINKY